MSDEHTPQGESATVKRGPTYIGRLTHWLAPVIAVFTYAGSIAIWVLGLLLGFATYISDNPSSPKESGFSLSYVVLQSGVFIGIASLAFLVSWAIVVLPTALFLPKTYSDFSKKKAYGTAISIITGLLLIVYVGSGRAFADHRDPTGFLRLGDKMDSKTPEGAKMRAERDARNAFDKAPVMPPTIADIQHEFDELIKYSQPNHINTNDKVARDALMAIGAIEVVPRKSYYGDNMTAMIPSPWAREFADKTCRDDVEKCSVPQMNLGERQVVRIISILPKTPLPATPENPAHFAVTFEWKYVPNGLGKRLIQSGFVPPDESGESKLTGLTGYDPNAVFRTKIDTAYAFKYGNTIPYVHWEPK